MPKKRATSTPFASDMCFVKELAGETSPSLAAMKTLYELASDLYGLRPWRALEESQLIVIRDSNSGELCYCSVMGALGEVYSMHAYLGAEGLRQYRKIEAEEIAAPGEFFAYMRCLYVEFVPKRGLQRRDRELLSALGHPQGRGVASPIFRSIRPGFYPWFVTAEEAHTLAECIRGVIVVCAAVASQKKVKFWDQADTYPMVTRVDEVEPRFQIDLVKSILPPEPAVAPATLPEETLRLLRSQDFTLRGTMELDYIFSGAAVGKKNERNACASVALAVDADTGIVYAPEVTDSSVAPGDALAKVFLKAVQSNRALPKEVRVRSEKQRNSLIPLMESFGVKVRVASRLPASDAALSHLLGFLGGEL